MSVKIKFGLGYSERTSTQYLDLSVAAKYDPPKEFQSTIPIDRFPSLPWSPWGTNNLLPLEMLSDIKKCGQLIGIIEGRTRLAICEGIQPVITKVDGPHKVIDRYVDDPDINEFLDTNKHKLQTFAFTKDYIGFHRCVTRIMLNKKRDLVATFQRDDVVSHRMEKMDKKGKINNVYYSAEWDKVRGVTDTRIFSKPLLHPIYTLNDLRRRVTRRR
jgi:hypothetical protein